jgi:hypothetical protein
MRYKTICPVCSTILFQRTAPKCFQGGGCNLRLQRRQLYLSDFKEEGLAKVEELEVQQATEEETLYLSALRKEGF